MTALLPEGLRDRLPPVADAAAALEARVLGAIHAHGYERVDPPLAEFAEGLGSRLKAGALQDAVRFVDPVSQRTLAIRPDLTAQVARIAATRMGHHPRPVRLSYAGAVLKLRASQLAPARETRQIGAELFGLDTVAAAQEVVTVAIEAVAAARVARPSIDFTLPDLVDTLAAGALPVAPEKLDSLRQRLDAKDAGAVAELAPDYLPLVAAAGPFDQALARLRDFDRDGALGSRLDALAAIARALDGRAVLTLDPTERHGFEYQTWLGFSLFAGSSSAEVGRGGTYTVVHEGGSEEAATGFSLFADRLIGDQPAGERRRLFLPFGTPAADGAAMRAEGWVTVAALEPGDTPEAQVCTHLYAEGEARPLD
ncbi:MULTISPECIES: ATP phosphoribosyltransferase regulatory subunit [unclassified Sphingomonas]|uniref:ATP phosphoribosyltransferase regulatory subunit n=1 Tax=unclassified Sphingomonas TaxID=196159 RepID=UPI00161A4C01|nr:MULTISPECIES: ATP phosphoribosyltransferase regulatory subunit [unclassified Sphingomonas]MBB3345582.1 ATP phosphoribosyltransferase regulatory subunit [Sphingomonas sp. BK069]MBB3474793.1 ATP phosphoribosyltransferase regulatory subunit [Sphingomonas sp. BK345]